MSSSSIPLGPMSNASSALNHQTRSNSTREGEEDTHTTRADSDTQPSTGIDAAPYIVRGNRNNTNHIRRDLEGYHIFFISVSGVLGAGLYLRSAAMLQVGGPVAVLVPYSILTLLAWLVMQCIGEMICIWPVSGALILFVDKFVDEELAIVVGVAYWITYSIGFASLVVATASEAGIWGPSRGLLAGCFFFAFPFALILFNLMGVKWYGRLEVLGGSIKLFMITIVVVTMCAINAGAGDEGYLGGKNLPSSANVYDETETINQGQAFFIALQIAAFAFVGIEIPAAAAVEARLTRPQSSSSRPGTSAASSQRTQEKTWYDRVKNFRSQPAAAASNGTAPSSGYEVLKFSATWLPVITGLVYLVAGFLVVLNVKWDNQALPRWQSWVADPRHSNQTFSGFVISAQTSKIPGLPTMFTVFIMFTALSSANTALYVASRTLFAMARYKGQAALGPGNAIIRRFKVLNHHGVPYWAVIFSALAFIWVPFLYLIDDSDQSNNAPMNVLSVLSEIGSMCCIFVWACECLAFLRFYKFLTKHENSIKREQIPYLRREDLADNEPQPRFPYPYKSYEQPYLAAFALILCVALILIIASGAVLWKNWSTPGFFASYFPLLILFASWLCLKIYRVYIQGRRDARRWFPKNLAEWVDFKDVLESLNFIRDARHDE